MLSNYVHFQGKGELPEVLWFMAEEPSQSEVFHIKTLSCGDGLVLGFQWVFDAIAYQSKAQTKIFHLGKAGNTSSLEGGTTF